MTIGIRWRIATTLDRLPGQCWSNLASWAMRDRRDDLRSYLNPLSPVDDVCRQDTLRCGSCYCGKLIEENGRAVLRGSDD